MLRLWGHRGSSNTQEAIWCLAELGIADYERIDLGGPFPGRREPAYLALNPNGQVPTLEDDGFVLWESNTICRYLCEAHGGARLIPADAQGRAIAGKWMDWQLAAANPATVALVRAVFRTPAPERDEALIRARAEAASEVWSRMEADFGAGPYVAGDFSIGDIPCGIEYHRYTSCIAHEAELLAGADLAAMPRLHAWYERLRSRPAFGETVLPFFPPRT